MTKEEKLNYAVLRSGFGDLWVGKIALPADEKTIFTDFDNALKTAKGLNDSIENTEELEDTVEEELEPLNKNMIKWIISN